MHTKLLRLSDQVTELLVQRSAFEEEKAQSDEIIKQLRREVAVLKTKVQQHHDKLDVCKRGIDDNAKEVKSMEQRLKAVPGNMESRFQHHATRLDKVESLLRGAGIQIKQHATQLRDGEERISQLEQNPGTITTTDPHNGPHAQREDFLDSRGKYPRALFLLALADGPTIVACLKLNVEKIQHTQDSHKSYLEKTGQTLITHQNNMDTISKTVDDLRSELKRLSTVNAVPRGDSSSIPTDAISRLQNQIDRLAEGARRKINNAESPKSNASSVTNVERLMIQMDEVRKEISTLSNMHRLSEQISLASKISLETMFYQLTKELEGRCAPENIEFGLDEDRIFILRQRVLERLSVEDNVQCEFLRLKESQQMFN